MRCCEGLPQQVWHHTSVLARRPATVRLNTSTLNAGLITSSTRLRAASMWICGSSNWITGQPASARSCSSALSASAVARLGADGAELDRLAGHPLRHLPDRGVLQLAAGDRPDDARHHPRFQVVVQDVPGREADRPAARRDPRIEPVEAAHVARRIVGPALAADVAIEMRIAVGDDVEAGDLLLVQ